MKATEKLREMFMENARARGFTNVTWEAGEFYAYLGRGGAESEAIPAETQRLIWKAIKAQARKAGII